MLYKHSKHLSGRYKKFAHSHFILLLCLWVHLLPQVNGFFMSDAKAVLQACDDHWTFQGQGRIPVLFQTTVCVDVQVLSPGEWTAFSYVSAPAPRYELALQGDENNLYAWLLGVRHQFNVQLAIRRWYHICLQWDALHKSFSLTIGGNSEVYQRTAIARAIPPSGRLLLGCQPNEAPPKVKMATVELYLFRIWDDVGEHKACEDGTVIGWDSRVWAFTRAQARVQDYTLQCVHLLGLGHLRLKRDQPDSSDLSSTTQSTATLRELVTTSQSPLYITLSSIFTSAQKDTTEQNSLPSIQVSASTSEAITTSTPAGPVTATSEFSVNLTTPPQIPLTSTTTITPVNQALTGSVVKNSTTVSNTGGLNTLPSTSPMSYVTTQMSQSTSTSSQTLSSHPISGFGTSETTANHMTASSPTVPTGMTQVTNQTAVLRTTTANALFTESSVVQCNFSQYCTNESSYYWMLCGSNMTEINTQIWFSDLFNMVSTTEINITSNQNDIAFVTSEVRCEDKQNIQWTNCTVLLELSHPVNTCIIRELLENCTSFDPSIQLLGDVERVGKGLCPVYNITPPGDGFVHCTSPMSLNDICEIQGPVNVTCSYKENGFVPKDLVSNQSCNIVNQLSCECHGSNNNETYYAVRLNITSPDVNFTYIQNMVVQLSTPCNESRMPWSLCNSFSKVSQLYQGIHLECFGDQTRLYTCMLALQLSKQLDVCTISTAIAVLWENSTNISFDGPLSRIAICRLPTDSETIPLNSTFTWVSLNPNASQSDNIEDKLRCAKGQTFAVLLNESCGISPSKSNIIHNKISSESSAIVIPPININNTADISPVQKSITSIDSIATQTNTVLNNTTSLPPNKTVDLTNQLVNKVGTSHHITTSIDSTTQTTLDVTTQPVNTSGTPHNITISQIHTTGTQNNVTSSPVSTTNATHIISTPTVSTTSIQNNITTSPVHTIDTTHNLTTSSVKITETTLNLSTSQVHTTDTTHNITTPPVSIAGTPHEITASMFRTTDNITSSLVKTTEMTPNITTSTTDTTHNQTTSPIETTKTTLEVTTSLVSTTDTTLNVTTQLVSTSGTPYNITSPVSTTDTTLNITTSSVKITETTLNISASQVHTTDSTHNITTSLVSTTDTTLNVTIPLVSTAGTPHNITTLSVEITGKTLNISALQVHTTDSTHNITTPSVSIAGTTLNVTIPLVSTAGTPHEITASMVRTTDNITSSLVKTTEMTPNITTSTTDTTHNQTTSPVETTKTTLEVTTSPVSTTDTTLNMATSPAHTIDTTHNLTTSSVKITETTLNISASQVHTTDSTHNITTSLVTTTDTTLNLTTSPVSTAGTPHNITTLSVEITGKTLNISASQVHTTDSTHNITTPPVSIAGTPHEITASMVRTTDNITSSLVKTTEMTPNITTSTTDTTHNQTTSPVETTETTLEVTTSLVSTTDTTLNVTTQLVSTAGTPHNITTLSVKITEKTLNISASQVHTTDSTHNITTSPVSTTDTTLNVTIPLVSTSGTPYNITSSVSTTDTTHNITTSPVSTTDTTLNVTIPLVSTSGTPHNINSSVSTTDRTHNLTTSPVSTRDTKLNMATSPAHTIDTTHNLTTSSVKITETTLNISASQVHTTDSTHNITTSPVTTTDTTLNVTIPLVSTSGTPHNITSSVSTTDTTLNITTSPVSTAGTPHNITTLSVEITGKTLNISASQVHTTDSTHNITTSPVSIAGTPHEITASMVRTTDNITSSLVKTTEMTPNITTSTTDTTHNQTTSPVETTKTTLEVTTSLVRTIDTTLNVTTQLVNTSGTPYNINSSVSTTDTTHNLTTSSVETTLNISASQVHTTDTTLYVATPMVSTTDTTLNVTTPLVNTSGTPYNITLSVSTTDTTHNKTTSPVSTTDTTLNATTSPVYITLSPLDKTTPHINTSTTLRLTVTSLNATIPLVSTTVTSVNTTAVTITTIDETMTALNTSNTPLNTTTMPFITTVIPLNLTAQNQTTLTTVTTKNASQSYTSSSQLSGAEFSTITFPPNTTLFNFINSSQITLQLNATTPPLNTEQHTATITKNLNNTILLHTTESPKNINESSTSQALDNTTELNTTAIPFDTNQLLHNSTLEITDAETNTTTYAPQVSTTFNITTFNTSFFPDVSYSSITNPLFNKTQSNTTPFTMNTTLFNTTDPNFNGTNVIRSINTTLASNNTSEFNTTDIPSNVTNFNGTNVHHNINTRLASNNTSEFNTTDIPSNVTNFNGTNVNHNINTTLASNNTSEFNTTVSPAVNTTQFGITNIAQILPTKENITSGPTDSTSEPITTVSLLNTTHSNGTVEEVFPEHTTYSNSTTTINPIIIPNNMPTNATISSIVTNNSTAPTTALPAISPSSLQNSSTSTTTGPSTTRSNTTAGTTSLAVPATPSIAMATTSEATIKSPDSVASDLLNQTQNVASLNSTQVNQLVNQLENLLSAPNISLEVGRTVLSVINNFLNDSPNNNLADFSNRLIKAVDNLALKLVIRDQTENIVFDSLALAVTKVDGTNFGAISFSMVDPLNPEVTKGFQRKVRAVESSSSIGKITLPASLTENLSPEQQKIASRVQFTFFQRSTFFQDNLTQHKLNSYILGTSVANLSIRNLRENVEFTLKNKQPIAENFKASCVFWDFDQNNGSGGWNPKGCNVKNSSTENETICSCNHLTSFAVLLDISQAGITDTLQAKILTFITYIGCGVSAIFLSVTLLTYLSFDKLRRDIPSKILIHLCFSLLFLNLVFLLDSWLALYQNAVGLCISTAFFLHYFLLVSFTWMGLEALHMYLAIVKVFNSYMSKYMLKFSLTGWGVPLVVVIIVISVNKDNYGLTTYGKFSDGTTDDFCWLKNQIAFYVSVVAYFCIIFVLNLAMFVVVMVHLRRIKRQNPHNNQYRSSLQDLRSIAGLTFLLGLTWGFAFFAWGPVNLTFMYLFTILNSLQGFFIFVFHCAMKENVRKQWRMYFCCGKLRLAENSEWSRIATQNNSNKKTSILTVQSSYSGTHSVPWVSDSVSSNESVRSHGIGSPVDDSLIISGEAYEDVVLNEINSQDGSV